MALLEPLEALGILAALGMLEPNDFADHWASACWSEMVPMTVPRVVLMIAVMIALMTVLNALAARGFVPRCQSLSFPRNAPS